VAYFPSRQATARAIAEITGERADYPGLDDERRHSQQIPQIPYSNQNLLIARHALDIIELVNINRRPTNEQQWRVFSSHESFISPLESTDAGFGIALRQSLLKEAEQQKLSLPLEQVEFSIWRAL